MRSQRARIFSGILLGGCFWIGNLATAQIRIDLAARAAPADVVDHVISRLAHGPYKPSFDHRDILGGLALVMFALLVWLYQMEGRANRRRGEEHGSARWARPREIRAYIDRKNFANNLLFTTTERLSLNVFETMRNLNALVLGSSGSGKSRFYVLPNLAQKNSSYVVTDSKGELLTLAGGDLQDAGYTIKCLNLVDFASSDTFNPLAYFGDQAEIDIVILTENIISNTTGKKTTSSNGGDFWEKAERALLSALISYVYFTQGPQGTLIDVVDLLARMEASEESDAATSHVDAVFAAVNELITEYDAEPNGYGPEIKDLVDGLRFAASQYRTFIQGAGVTKKSVIISLGVRMAPLHMTPLRALLSSNTIGLDTVGDERTALFLVVPDTHAAFNFLTAIAYEQLFDCLIRRADKLLSRTLPHPVQCFMDEFANIGKIPSFERKIAVMRSRGISVSVLCQTFSQGKALYRDDWETIVGNCDSLLYLGGFEKSTTEYVSKLLGKQTITGTDLSQSRGRNGSWTLQDRSLGRELLTPDELARLDTSTCIYILRGLNPFKSKKLDTPAWSAKAYAHSPSIDNEFYGWQSG